MKAVITILSIALFSLLTFESYSQEIKCVVSVTAKDQQASDASLYENLKKVIQQFMNAQVWTDNVFDDKEKIEMNIAITVKARTGDNFDATIQIQANRPVFGSSYKTVMFNFVDDKLQFSFQEFGTIEYDDQRFNSNLTYVLEYYAFIVLGLDYDSFSPNGGTKWFQKAEMLVNNAQTQTDYTGWKAFENQENKYWLVENYLNSAYSPYRTCLYTYHRLGLDIMNEKPTEGRAKIAEALAELEKVHAVKPGLIMMTAFFQAKSKEIIGIFAESQPDEKARVSTLCKKVDPARASDYDKINAQK
jgi:hypothetical protein